MEGLWRLHGLLLETLKKRKQQLGFQWFDTFDMKMKVSPLLFPMIKLGRTLRGKMSIGGLLQKKEGELRIGTSQSRGFREDHMPRYCQK
mmetsp:Transcript_1016/g.2584  ORF Transcript_1016/g.2584 Transcript_1016/m.2584 type:complete len:89 (-) Transcript_1016:799-1065(-)